jgi:uncharacterized protein YxjI
MVKKIVSLREHYDFQDRSGIKIGEGDGNFVQVPAKFVVYDQNMAEVMYLQGKIISLRKEVGMYDPSGKQLGNLKKEMIKLFGSEYWFEKDGAEYMRIYGNFTEHDYAMDVNQVQVAQVHKKWVSVRDQFGISIVGEVDPRLVIGSVIAVEHVEVTERKR